MTPPIFIWIRKPPPDWADEEAVWRDMQDEIRPKARTWNETFTMPWHEWRRRIAEIASANHARVEDAPRLNFPGWSEIPEGAIVIPVDDDDWFSPTIAREIQRAWREDVGFYYWPPAFVEVPKNFRHRLGRIARRHFGMRPLHTCMTNGYAIVKRPGVIPLLQSHYQATLWIDADKEPAINVDRLVAVQNRTLGSVTQMHRGRPTVSRRELVHKYHLYVRMYPRKPPRGLEWTTPYRAMMAELIRELEPLTKRGRRTVLLSGS